jgi:hypothetical protein
MYRYFSQYVLWSQLFSNDTNIHFWQILGKTEKRTPYTKVKTIITMYSLLHKKQVWKKIEWKCTKMLKKLSFASLTTSDFSLSTFL